MLELAPLAVEIALALLIFGVGTLATLWVRDNDARDIDRYFKLKIRHKENGNASRTFEWQVMQPNERKRRDEEGNS